ncbi:MAG: DegT/DnrJ/EryC1/StrS family aminotransferase [Gemmatimonadota bacterium]|nr:DegT/DnrJ/EryC1/StrS family aminotransferase [Gemmatimonadota bacterium]MDE2984291.1 DegT/DnrJ/EryC1/StrS family aminotransferase [Gemmatimonadota bacterium]
MKVPLLDLTAQYASIRDEIDTAMAEVVTSQRFILGAAVEACEDAIARYVGSDHAIGVSSGTDALLVALMAEGIGPGDEVVTTPYSFFATAGVIARVGATPVFADIDPVTLNLDPARVADSVTKRTRAVIPVHLFGQMAEMAPIMEIARSRGLAVIEDAAQAIGAEHGGRRAGSIGDYGCFSFFPSKNLGCFGDGGMVVTNDAARADRVRALRVHGEDVKYHHRIVGGNFRLDALQAAVVRAKLPHLDGWIDARRANAALYSRLLGDLADREPPLLTLPGIVTDRHVFNQYAVRVTDRDRVREELAAAGIGTAVYYPRPLHLQECLAALGYRRGDLPESERAADRAIALPIYPELTTGQIRTVADALRGALAGLA